VAKATRQIMSLVPVTTKPRSVRAPSGRADTVASDAELLTGAAVTTRARCRVDTRLHAMVAPPGSYGDPSLWVRAA
jgi:hypothetical protein